MRTDVLDHGYVEIVETWGSDERIVEAARMSTGKGFLGWGSGAALDERRERFHSTTGAFGYTTEAGPTGANSHPDRCKCQGDETTPHKHYTDPPHRCARCNECSGYDPAVPGVGDEKLLRYLWENKHATPFEMAGMVIEAQAPIFVLREWFRHRTQSYNEMSARYVPLPDLNYVPTVERLLVNSKSNKQAGTVKGAEELTEASAERFRAFLVASYEKAEQGYQEALKAGVPKELARIHLPVGRYSRMRASANLRNWLGFLTLRLPSAAQWEIRQYANAVGELVKENFPRTWELFDEGRK